MLSSEFKKEYYRQHGRSPWQCKYCDVIIKDKNKVHHLNTQKHKLKKQIYKLSKKQMRLD